MVHPSQPIPAAGDSAYIKETFTMGINDRKAEAREVKRNEKRRRQAVPQASVAVDDINPDTLLYCLHSVTSNGGAVRFGTTRDKGAWAIGVYGDGAQPYTEYVRPDEDINLYLRNLGDFFAGNDPLAK